MSTPAWPRNLIVADTHKAARDYAREHDINRPTVVTTIKALEGCPLNGFQLHLVNSRKWRKGMFELLQALAARENHLLSTCLPPSIDGVARSIAHPDGTIRDRAGNVCGGWGAGGAGNLAVNTVSSHGTAPDQNRSSAISMTIGRLGA